MADKKVELGQFFTAKSIWLRPQVAEFINKSNCKIAYDPYAGNGDLLNVAKEMGLDTIGCDIDETLPWKINDSLVSIPYVDGAIILTNPPYLAKQSATRKKIDLSKYWNATYYDDLYLLALDKMTETQQFVVAIIPESFINSSYKRKCLLSSITILEDNPFVDTECPVCVACFDGRRKDYSQIKIYKNSDYVATFQEIDALRIEPKNNLQIDFNDLSGWLGLRAIDSTDDKTFICFDFKENIDYDWQHKIKTSSRHFSLINVDIPKENRADFIEEANAILQDLRKKSCDILLTPFMGNTHKGMRRRRLDFRLARAIIEEAYRKVCKGGQQNHAEQLTLF